MTMCRLASVLLVATLFVVLVNGQNIPNLKDPANLNSILKGLYGRSKGDFKIPSTPVNPSAVINYLMKYYCTILMQEGVTNLPDICYTLELKMASSQRNLDSNQLTKLQNPLQEKMV